jgi:hypothetical protein
MDGRRGPLAFAAAIAAVLVFAAPAQAMPDRLTPQGQSDFVFGPAVQQFGGGATGSKPESKLFFTPDRRWWAVLSTSGDASTPAGVNLYELVDHVWQFRVHLPQTDPWEKADALYDRRGLAIAVRDNGDVPDNPRASRLYRLRYQGGGAWTGPSGPTAITSDDAEGLTIARDSRGRLWAAWVDAGALKLAYTRRPGSGRFSRAPSPGGTVSGDDIAAVVAFGTRRSGRRIGVMWSDQVSQVYRFASRGDRSRVTRRSWRRQTAYGAGVGGCPTPTSALCADDHISLRASGRELYAVVKTSLNDAPAPGVAPSQSDPLNVLLRRSRRGRWSAFTVTTVAENTSRAALLLAPAWSSIWVFAQKDFDDVFVWESNFRSPGFDPRGERPWTIGVGARNDPTATKQSVPAGLPPVVETSMERATVPTYDYWHNEFLP